jgi:anaerobic selenocysteine-containing dehydrogenase
MPACASVPTTRGGGSFFDARLAVEALRRLSSPAEIMADALPSICRLCPAFCPILVTVEDGRVARVEGDRSSSLYGGYTCPKGRALPEQHNHPERLRVSLERGADGRHHPIASERAMDEVAARVAAILERHGPRSIALYVGTNALPYPLSGAAAHSWHRALGSRMFFTSNTIDQPGKQIALALHGGWIAGAQDFETAGTWLIVGQNPIISKSAGVPSQNPTEKLRAAEKRGLQLIVIDPRRTETARRARIHLQPRPGEDPPLLAAMLHVIFAEGLEDRDFLAENAAGVDALREACRFFSPAHAAERAGVSAEQIVAAARVFARGGRGGVTCGTGPSFATHGTLTEYLGLALTSVCGYWPRVGDRVTRPNVLLPAFVAKAQPYPPYKAWGYGEHLRVRGLTNTAAGLPTAALADEILTEGEGQVRALFCVGGNPMMAWPDQRRTYEALRKLELLVTFDPEMSATARLADYVIAPRLTLETPGMTQPAEMLKYFGPWVGFSKPYAQYSPRIVEPPPGSDVIEEWEFFHGLARRMGLPLHLVAFYGWGRHVESPPHVVALDMERKPATDELYEILTAGARIPLAEVKRHPHGHVFDEVDERVAPRDPGCVDRLDVGNPDMLGELEAIRRDGDAACRSTPDFPFRLVPRRANNFMNSSGRHLASLTRGAPYNPAFMHPQDLVALGLSSGDVVRIRSRHDAILGIVCAEEALRPGVVSMTHGFGGLPGEDDSPHEMGSSTARLLRVDDDYDPVSGIPRMGALPVAIERVGGLPRRGLESVTSP